MILRWIDGGAKAEESSMEKLYKRGQQRGKGQMLFPEKSSSDYIISLPEKSYRFT